MQTVTETFDTNSKKGIRKLSAEFSVQWGGGLEFFLLMQDGTGFGLQDGGSLQIQDSGAKTYQDETDYVKSIEAERKVNEPLGGVHLAQFDVSLTNISRRFTPGSGSAIEDFLIRYRKALISLGFDGENILIGKGRSDPPDIDETNRTVKLHFFDELEYIQNFKLSDGGELFTDIRTDSYIWEILDQVYAEFYTTLASFDSTETWVGGTAETTDQRLGDAALIVESTAGAEESAYMDTSLNLTDYRDEDKVGGFVYVDDPTKLEALKIRFHSDVGSSFADIDLLPLVQQGWNQFEVDKSTVVTQSTLADPFEIEVSEIEGPDIIPMEEFSWFDVSRIEVFVDATGADTTFCIFDEFRMYKDDFYPRRSFDIGLQTIPVAEWSGNTALFEIKTAAEAEGARFYADEQGTLRFENRQHYITNEQYKITSHNYQTDRIFTMNHPANEQGLVNSVAVKLQPRTLVATKEIWSNPFVTEIGAGQTKQIWASFNDPVPTTITGIVTPVATTDYTANANEDGSGADKTGDVSITITRFTKSALLEVENTSGSTMFMTMLKLRGTPAEKGDAVFIYSEDADSIADFGETPSDGYRIDNKYMASVEYAETLADQLVLRYKQPLTRLAFKVRAIPQVQIGDMVTVTNDLIEKAWLMRVLGIKLSLSEAEGMMQTINCREVTSDELADYFTIGTSEIGGSDVIST